MVMAASIAATGDRKGEGPRETPRGPSLKLRSAELAGLVVDLQCDLGELGRVGLAVVAAEEEFAAGGEGDPYVGLGSAAVATVSCGQRFGNGSAHQVLTLSPGDSTDRLASGTTRLLPSFVPGAISVGSNPVNPRHRSTPSRECKELLPVRDNLGR